MSHKTLLGLDRRLTTQLRKQIAQIEALLSAAIEQDQALSGKARKLTSIVGVGPRTATLLLAQMPELGQLNRREAAALAGLAPFNRDSGSLQGKRAIFGGRRAVRCGLYMAALVAARRNPILAPFYQRLRQAGKPPKLALTATMRKLLIVLNSVLKPIRSRLELKTVTTARQSSALASRRERRLEARGFEPLTSSLQSWRSTN